MHRNGDLKLREHCCAGSDLSTASTIPPDLLGEVELLVSELQSTSVSPSNRFSTAAWMLVRRSWALAAVAIFLAS